MTLTLPAYKEAEREPAQCGQQPGCWVQSTVHPVSWRSDMPHLEPQCDHS
jgi:hypothetical protein